MGDGQGSISSMRLLVASIILSVLAPAVYSAFATHTALTLTPANISIIAMALGYKCVQNAQENSQPTTIQPTTTQPKVN